MSARPGTPDITYFSIKQSSVGVVLKGLHTFRPYVEQAQAYSTIQDQNIKVLVMNRQHTKDGATAIARDTLMKQYGSKASNQTPYIR